MRFETHFLVCIIRQGIVEAGAVFVFDLQFFIYKVSKVVVTQQCSLRGLCGGIS